MKIGILTYHSVCNFGANLQALSTFEYIRNAGHDPIFIDWITRELENSYRMITPKEQYYCHEEFRNTFFKLTKRCYTSEDVANVIVKYGIEAVIVGSDAVSQHHPLLSRIAFPCRRIIVISKISEDRICPNPFWGDFEKFLTKPIPMVMMSVSSQNSSYKLMSFRERKMMNVMIHKFSYISTRDDWTSKMFSFVSHKDIKPLITPDPVFAFNNNVSFIPTEAEIRNKYDLHGKYYLLSFLNSKTVTMEWLKLFQYEASKKDINCVALPFPHGLKFDHPFQKQIEIPLNPLDWFALIKYSSAYIGDNMHPIVVCLHNGIPCYSFDHYGEIRMKFFVNEKSSKVYHIMNHFGVLENRVSIIKRNYRCPSVYEVMDKLAKFNVLSVKKSAENMYKQYEEMMDQILLIFKRWYCEK